MKKYLLVTSFGTSYPETRKRTIGAIEEDLAKAFPDREIRTAWTSNFLIKKVGETEGLHIDSVEEAMDKLVADGCQDLLVQPTHLTDGFENRRMLGIIEKYQDAIGQIRVGSPLLYTEQDRMQIANDLAGMYLDSSDQILLLMGHGSGNHPVTAYVELQELLFQQGYEHIIIGTVEGEPDFDEAREKLEEYVRRTGIEREGTEIVMAPLMIVAGDHATNDMTGDDPESWKSQFLEEGYTVCPVLAGLGEYCNIREMFAAHAAEAEDIAVWLKN